MSRGIKERDILTHFTAYTYYTSSTYATHNLNSDIMFCYISHIYFGRFIKSRRTITNKWEFCYTRNVGSTDYNLRFLRLIHAINTECNARRLNIFVCASIFTTSTKTDLMFWKIFILPSVKYSPC